MTSVSPAKGLPYPDPGDLVTNAPAAFKALVDALDVDKGAVGFSGVLTANQSIPNALWTDLTGWVESEDTNAALSAGVFTAPVRGIYTFAASIFWQTNANGARYLAFWFCPAGGAYAEIPGQGLPASSIVDTRQVASCVTEMMPGDKIVPRAFQNSGAPLNVAAASTNRMTFGGALLMRTAS